jgi:hypothetical protein
VRSSNARTAIPTPKEITTIIDEIREMDQHLAQPLVASAGTRWERRLRDEYGDDERAVLGLLAHATGDRVETAQARAVSSAGVDELLDRAYVRPVQGAQQLEVAVPLYGEFLRSHRAAFPNPRAAL